MVEHRYWRLVGFAVPGNGALELSEAQLYSQGVRVGASITPACTIAPTSGLLSDLNDGLATGVVSWPVEAHRSSGFALTWDLTGTGADVDALRLGSGSSAATFPLDLTAQYSDNGTRWVTLSKTEGAAFPGPMALTEALAGGDPHIADVKILLHGEGSSIVDSSANPTTWTNYGALVSTTEKKVGASAVRLGVAQYLQLADPNRFALFDLDFTWESWVHTAQGSGPGQGMLYYNYESNFAAGAVYWGKHASLAGRLGFYAANFPAALLLEDPTLLPDNTWVHLAVTRLGDLFTLWRDGAPVATNTFSGPLTSGTVERGYIGSSNTGSLNGYVDEYRFTIGTARYTVPFAPPVTVFPETYSGLLPVQNPRPSRVGSTAPAPASLPGSGHQVPPGGTVAPAAVQFMDVQHGGQHRIAGTVKEKGNPTNVPLRRRVLLLDERSQLVIRETWSNAATGAYAFAGIRGDITYTVMTFDSAKNYRAVIADNLTPELMPGALP